MSPATKSDSENRATSISVEVGPRLAADEAGDALRRQAGLFGGAHDAAHLVTDVTGDAALGLAQRRPLAKRAPAFAALMPAAELALTVVALMAELTLAVATVARAATTLAAELTPAVVTVARAVAAVTWAATFFVAERPLPASSPVRAIVSLMDNNRNLGQFAFSLCIYPALGRFGLSSAPIPRSRLALRSFPCVLNIY